jgi:hypothetical protein
MAAVAEDTEWDPGLHCAEAEAPQEDADRRAARGDTPRELGMSERPARPKSVIETGRARKEDTFRDHGKEASDRENAFSWSSEGPQEPKPV